MMLTNFEISFLKNIYLLFSIILTRAQRYLQKLRTEISS